MAEIDKLHLIAAMLGRDLETVRARSTGFTAPKSAPGDVVLSAEGLRIGRKVRDARSKCASIRSLASPGC
jgi:galactofuranose transport system ATP-binding protein